MSMDDTVWVPPACTLPTVEQPLRLAEFDDLFATVLREQERVTATRLRWQLDPAAGERARDLAARESSCCSFFTFAFTTDGDVLQVDVDVPEQQVAVLDALGERAAARIQR